MATPPQPPYPHVSEIQDWPTQRTIQLLWDQVTQLKAGLAATNTTVATHDTTLGSLQSQVSAAAIAAANANAPNTPGALATGGATGGGGSSSGGGGDVNPPNDGGQGELGCTQSGSNGHVAPNAPLTAFTIGQIVCGVAKEFPALFAVAPDQATLDGFRTEYINRVIWHLNLAGFSASHYGSDPTSAQYTYLILVSAPGVGQYAYRISNYDPTLQLQPTMVFGGLTPGAPTTPDGGTPD